MVIGHDEVRVVAEASGSNTSSRLCCGHSRLPPRQAHPPSYVILLSRLTGVPDSTSLLLISQIICSDMIFQQTRYISIVTMIGIKNRTFSVPYVGLLVIQNENSWQHYFVKMLALLSRRKFLKEPRDKLSHVKVDWFNCKNEFCEVSKSKNS